MVDTVNVRIKRLTDTAKLPLSGSAFSAGCDLFADTDESIMVRPHESVFLHTGLAMEIPEGYFGAIYARSGMATKFGLRPCTCVSVIDSDYRGEVMIGIYNDSNDDQFIVPYERVAQMVIQPYLPVAFEEAKELSETERGNGGFGSTGRR